MLCIEFFHLAWMDKEAKEGIYGSKVWPSPSWVTLYSGCGIGYVVKYIKNSNLLPLCVCVISRVRYALHGARQGRGDNTSNEEERHWHKYIVRSRLPRLLL